MAKIFESFTNTLVEVERLNEVSEDVLTDPIQDGKWSIREIVAHLHAWDEHTLEVWLPQMEDGASLSAFPEPEAFNDEAISAVEGRPVKVIIEDFTVARKKLVSQLLTVDPDARFTIGTGKRQFAAESFAKMFNKHDAHHLEQIQDKLNR